MAAIAAAVAFLAMLTCAGGAQAPAPAPLRQSTPAPVHQSAPTPATTQEAAPEPTPYMAPPEGSATPVTTPYMAPPEGSAAPETTPYTAPPEGSAAPGPMPYMGPTEGLPPAAPCFTELFNMTDCLSYVQAGSNLTSPDKGCCPELAGLVESKPVCLCQLFANSKSYGIDLDMGKALKLPSACQLSTPPLTACALLGVPVVAPAASNMPPTGSETASPQSTPPPASSMGSTSFRISLPVFLSGLWVVLSLIV